LSVAHFFAKQVQSTTKIIQLEVAKETTMPAFFRYLSGVSMLVLAFSAAAQTNVVGQIYGRVELENGEPATGALVIIVNQQTGLQRSLPVRTDGGFRYSALPVGRYSMRVTSAGSIPAEREDVTVNLGSGTRTLITLLGDDDVSRDLGVLEVVGRKISPIDVSSVESATRFDSATLERLSIERDPASVALLAPGTTRGDVDLGDGPLVSFGGASVAENAYWINGMEVTNFRNGLGGSTVPFEFYEQFQIKTGGYGAEFGRSTGGVVNSVTKRGGNEWDFGAGAYWAPDSLRENSPDVSRPPGSPNAFLDYWRYNSGDELDVLDAHAYASGPVVDEHLFFYAIVQQRREEGMDDLGPATPWEVEQLWVDTWDDENTFWGLKLDWQVNPDHLVEFTTFSDEVEKEKTLYEFDFESEQMEPYGNGLTYRGGANYILRYTGHLSPDITLSALAGYSEYDRTDASDSDDIPVTYDDRDGTTNPWPTDWVYFNVGTSVDERWNFRFDGQWNLEQHLLRFGMDRQENTSDDLQTYSGGVFWEYLSVTPGGLLWGEIPIPDDVNQVVIERIRNVGGSFDSKNTAFYIEDHWQANDNLMLYLGLRNEVFDNRNAAGETYLKMDNQWGPRLGFSWDTSGDGTAKLFGTAGRYHLPLPTKVSVVLSGALYGSEETFVLNELNPDGSPDRGPRLGGIVWANGEIPDTEALIHQDLEPSYQDEFILGYVFESAPGWSLGARGIYRDLKQAIEDTALGESIYTYALANGYENYNWDCPYFVLVNPGDAAHVRCDLDSDGTREEIHLTAAEIGLPKVERTYKALEVFFEKVWDGTWYLQGSYTWSESKGNYEGWTRSEFNQASPAQTSHFDFPTLTEGSYGLLANDRPHTLKLFGNWFFAERWQLSGNFLFQSGRPLSAYGIHPSGTPNWNQAFFDNGEVVQRGSRGRTDDLYRLDLGLQYVVAIGDEKGLLKFRVDVFNLFDSDTSIEHHELTQRGNGSIDPRFGLPRNFQQPRYVRLSARMDF
jgi:hypothetical protein